MTPYLEDPDVTLYADTIRQELDHLDGCRCSRCSALDALVDLALIALARDPRERARQLEHERDNVREQP